MATINFIDHEVREVREAWPLLDLSMDLFRENFNYVNYKTISKDNLNYFPLHIRQPFDVEDAINQIPNDIFLLMQQGVIKPLIIMVTEQWDLFDTYSWQSNKFNLTPDFGNVPYSKMIQKFTRRSVAEENITWLVPMDHHVKQIQFLRKKGYSIKAKMIQYDYFLEIIKPLARENRITAKQFKKYFSCLCRGTPRNHRFGLVYNLWGERLLEKGNVSCGTYVDLEESKESNWINDTMTTENFMSKFSAWPEKSNEFKNTLPIEYDSMDNQHWFRRDESKIFSDAFVWIASETKKMHDGIYITEKTWKAIAYGSPFLINGDNGSLDYLHQQGYKTFHDYWDESYDHMDDHGKINHICGIVKNLCSKPLTEINSLYEKMIPILEHNQKTLINNMQHDNLVKELSNG